MNQIKWLSYAVRFLVVSNDKRALSTVHLCIEFIFWGQICSFGFKTLKAHKLEGNFFSPQVISTN